MDLLTSIKGNWPLDGALAKALSIAGVVRELGHNFLSSLVEYFIGRSILRTMRSHVCPCRLTL